MSTVDYYNKNILILGMVLVIIILFILNYQKSNEIVMLQSKLQSTEKMKDIPKIKEYGQNVIPAPTVIPQLAPPKDTIRLYYADWCGHSQRMLPEWDAFAMDYKNKLAIEKIDCEKYRNKCASVSGFPTIRLYKSGDVNKVIEFSGERTASGLKKFVDANM